MIPDWLQPTFLLLPALLWMCFGVGIPWALAILPRADWKRRIEVIAVALALGPALTTTVMFTIGTIGQWSRANILIATTLIALLGWVLALRQRPQSDQISDRPDSPLNIIDGALILALGVVIALHFWNTAYWPYDNYDELWVYGYNAEMFTLHHAIPAAIGYYPQLLPLGLTYGQVMWGGLSEHAARTIVPYLTAGSILITYVLGSRLFGRRAGLIGAAVWALYPQAAGWAQYADLEIPVTFYFTGAAAYFMIAWLNWHQPGNLAGKGSARAIRYAILGGIFAGAALWTKPTAGALIDSGVLIGVIIALKLIIDHRSAWRDRFMAAIGAIVRSPLPIFALTLIPMGGMWYVRNILLSHPPLTFPGSYWLDEADRSGLELGWPLITVAILSIYIIISPMRRSITWARLIVIGFALLLIGALPSAFGSYRLTVIDYAILAIGSGLWLWGIWGWWTRLADRTQTIAYLTLAFIVPYFVTWFWSYSYHYRLSFAIVPLFSVLIGVGIERMISAIVVLTSPPSPLRKRERGVYTCLPSPSLRAERGTKGVRFWRVRLGLLTAAIVIGVLPGEIAAISAWGFVQTDSLTNDYYKQQAANPALIALVGYLQWKHPVGRPMRVYAPGELRLAYFFPDDQIETGYPTQLDQIADADFFIDSSVGQRLYRINGDDPSYVQILASMTRPPIMTRGFTTDDGQFRYSVYTVNTQARFTPPTPVGSTPDTSLGSVAHLIGYDLSTLKNSPGQKIFLTLYWQSIQPTPIDYSVFIHLWDAKAQKLISAWGGEPVSGMFSIWQPYTGPQFSDPYHTRLWQPGEYIRDEWLLTLDPNTPPGQYNLIVGLFDPNATGNQRLPVIHNGQPAGDGVSINTITVTAP